MKKRNLLLLIALFLLIVVKAATVDTVLVHSSSMNKNVKAVIIAPKQLKTDIYPVVYLLHGYGGNEKNWINIKPNIPEIADQYKIIFVCPDGKNSWYWDSPLNSDYRYETFVSKELTGYVDAHYNTRASREGRAITGLSMGGHGALWLSLRHKDIFGAAGSTSGGVDIRPFPNNWEMKKQLGEYETNKEMWDNHTVINQLDNLKNGELALIIDCGYDDFFFEVNNNLHKKLLDNKINHDFLVRPGVHNDKYWNNSIDYQILFFKRFFDGYKE